MRQFTSGDGGTPTPEHLTAYVDKQLDPELRTGVETWLRDHPGAAAEIEGHHQLAALWKATTPSKPPPARWAAVLRRVQIALFRSRTTRVQPRRLRRIGAGAGWAAALLLVLWWSRGCGPAEGPAAGEPLAVVSSDDVEIISLRAADRVTLVVGTPPVTGPLVWASAHDVNFEHIEPDADGMVPSIQINEPALTPVVVAPLDAAAARLPERVPE